MLFGKVVRQCINKYLLGEVNYPNAVTASPTIGYGFIYRSKHLNNPGNSNKRDKHLQLARTAV
jgi:hypothetical protein